MKFDIAPVQNSVKEKPVRFDWMDYARGIAIILVVYRHAFEGIKRSGISVADFNYLEYANIIFFSFRMPLFFIISGVFISKSLQKSGLAQTVLKKLKFILYPYFIWGCIQITLQILMSSYVNTQRGASDYLLLFYDPRRVEQFWYLYALFNTTVLFIVLKSVLKLTSIHQLVLGGVLFAFSIVASNNNWSLYFINDIAHYYLFFVLGDAFGSFIRSQKVLNTFSTWRMFLILLPLFAITQLYFLYANLNSSYDKYLFVEYHQPFLYIIIALVGCMFMMNISTLLQKVQKLQWLKFVGFHSLYIYVCHVIITSATRTLATKVLHINNVPLVLLIEILFGIILPIVFYLISKKIQLYWLFTLENPQKKQLRATIPGVNKAVNSV